MTATARPRAARTAPARVGDVQPQPAASTRPPIQAPPALARLKADWLEAAARVGACWALFMTSIWRGVVVRKPTAPMRTTVTSAAHFTWAVKWKAASTRARAASEPYRVGRRARSVSGPAASAPRVIPMPKRARTSGTEPAAKPVTSVIIDAR